MVDRFEGRRCGELIREGDVSACKKPPHVRAMFILYAECSPNPPSEYFGQSNDEGQYCGVLKIIAKDGIEYPIEAEDWVDYNSDVVEPGLLETESFAEENMGSCWI